MSRFLALFPALLFSVTALAQTNYSVLKDPSHPDRKMLVGMISPYILQNDSSFSWFEAGQKNFKPASSLLDAVSSASPDLYFLVFAGTWCEDSHFIIPRFFRLLEVSGFSFERVAFYVLDRNKKMPGALTAALGITNVPTIIVMKKGKEAGRVVEYGKTGKWEEELAELIR